MRVSILRFFVQIPQGCPANNFGIFLHQYATLRTLKKKMDLVTKAYVLGAWCATYLVALVARWQWAVAVTVHLKF